MFTLRNIFPHGQRGLLSFLHQMSIDSVHRRDWTKMAGRFREHRRGIINGSNDREVLYLPTSTCCSEGRLSHLAYTVRSRRRG